MYAMTILRAPQRLQLRFLGWLSRYNRCLTIRYQAFLSRRPHRSFRRSYRRDYARSLHLPGYISFTKYVSHSILQHRVVYFWLIALYASVILLMGGITNQETYTQINDLMKQSSGTLFNGGINTLGQAGLLLLGTVLGGADSMEIDQQIYLGLALMMVWLTTVWLLREFRNDKKPTLRDGLYNAGAPLVPTLLVVCVLMIQLLPIGAMSLVSSGLWSVGLAKEGFGAMLLGVCVALVAALTLYWLTSTLVALVVVTLPGMYPFRALKISSDLVIGRRLRILFRWLWAVLVVAVMWILIMVPIILFDGWLKDAWKQAVYVPIVPGAVAGMSALTSVWSASYVYLLYRKVVEDDAKPA